MPVAEATMLSVEVASDKASAELVIPAGCPSELLAPDSFAVALRVAGVLVDTRVMVACEQLATRAKADPASEHRGVVAQARLPVDGIDGAIEWLVARRSADDEGSHYDRCAFTMVTQGQEIARVLEPTAAQDGCDVTGQVIAARPGKPAAFRLDDSILMDSRGVLTAQVSGALDNTSDVIRVRNVLNIEDFVDFSTGNISFSGDVTIGKGVRDCFTVHAKGNVRCDGVIEAATIECQGDLVTRGMAGRDQGVVRAAGKLIARYIDSITAKVGLDLCVERSIVNCKTLIYGAVDSPHATLIGGRHVVTGQIKVHTLGSPANVPTELVVGTVPQLDPFLHRLVRLVSDLEQRLGVLQQENAQILAEPHPTPTQKETLTELCFNVMRCEQALARGKAAEARLREHIAHVRKLHVEISHVMHLGTLINYEGQVYQVREDIKGPLSIERGSDGQPVIRCGGVVRGPLSMIADAKAAA